MSAAYVYDAVRTPFGRYGGALAAVRPDDLAAHVTGELVARSPQLDPGRIDESMFGDANQAGEDNRDVARMASLLAGLPTSVPGTTINRDETLHSTTLGWADGQPADARSVDDRARRGSAAGARRGDAGRVRPAGLPDSAS